MSELEPRGFLETEVSVAEGSYQDPDPKIVEWLNKRFKHPHENIEATLMKAFEWTGIVKTIKEINELAKPLEQSGVLPPTTKGLEPPEFTVNEEPTSEFTDRRDLEILLELQEGNDTRNSLLERVRAATVRRRLMDEQEEAELVQFIRGFRHEQPDFTPAYRILRVMVGMMPPEDPEKALSKNTVLHPETVSLAPDVYFLLLKEERDSHSQSIQQPA